MSRKLSEEFLIKYLLIQEKWAQAQRHTEGQTDSGNIAICLSERSGQV